MALELLCSNEIMKGNKIILPRVANMYKMNFSKNKIDFYYSNPEKNSLELNTWKIPLNAREIEFDAKTDRIGGFIVIPRFYDVNGNLLKIGNR